MTCLNGTLYCTIDDKVYHIDLANETFGSSTQSSYLSLNTGDTNDVCSTCAHNNAFYYTADGGLYRAEFSATGNDAKKATCVLKGDSFGALTSYGGSLYCIRGKSVLRFDTDGANYKIADYEISSASASVGRLSGAKDIVRAGSLVVTADADNHRVSVYNGDTGAYSVLTPEGDATFSPALVATDGKTIAVTDGTKIYVCEYSANKPLNFNEPFSSANGNIKGIACVYGKAYYVTENNYHGVLDGNSVTKSGTGGNPSALTSDLYGNLYVAYTDGTVHSFTEEQFLANGDAGKTLEGVNIPTEAKALRAGFDGTLYYLDNNGQLCSADGTEPQPLATVDGQNFVYTGGESKTPTSFALGFEDDEVYFLFGDFIVKSNAGALGLETLESVSAAVLESSAEALASVHSPDGTNLIDFHEGAVGIHVDLGALEGDRPCCSGYARFAEARRGVLLAESGGYSLVALYREHTYSVELFRSEDGDAPFAPSFGGLSAEETMYLASECTPYNYPCILPSPARAEAAAPRGARVRVLDVVRAGGSEETLGGYDFAYIEYETAARAVLRGYVPLAYLTTVDPLGSETQSFFLGYVKPGAVFLADDGSSMHIEEKVQARLYENEDGTYTAVYTSADGVEYTANVTKDMIDRGESDALRIALIVILSVVACLIIGGYVYLLPKNKKK